MNHRIFYDDGDKRRTVLPAKKKKIKRFFFPVPIFRSRDDSHIFDHHKNDVQLDFYVDFYKIQKEISITEEFKKKEFCLYNIPEKVLNYLNNFDNCVRTHFNFVYV